MDGAVEQLLGDVHAARAVEQHSCGFVALQFVLYLLYPCLESWGFVLRLAECLWDLLDSSGETDTDFGCRRDDCCFERVTRHREFEEFIYESTMWLPSTPCV